MKKIYNQPLAELLLLAEDNIMTGSQDGVSNISILSDGNGYIDTKIWG